MATQEIIVYRNPMEQQVWHALSNGELFPIMVAMIAALLTIVACIRLVDKYASTRYRKVLLTNASLLAGAVVAVIVIWAMWI